MKLLHLHAIGKLCPTEEEAGIFAVRMHANLNAAGFRLWIDFRAMDDEFGTWMIHC